MAKRNIPRGGIHGGPAGGCGALQAVAAAVRAQLALSRESGRYGARIGRRASTVPAELGPALAELRLSNSARTARKRSPERRPASSPTRLLRGPSGRRALELHIATKLNRSHLLAETSYILPCLGRRDAVFLNKEDVAERGPKGPPYLAG